MIDRIKHHSHLFLALILAGASAGACASSPKPESAAMSQDAGALEGKTFEVMTTTPDGKSESDTLTFTGGQFESIACRPYGFSSAKYTSSNAGGQVRFAAQTSSDKEGQMQWEGVVEGSTVRGRAIWVKAGQDSTTIEFTGKIKE